MNSGQKDVKNLASMFERKQTITNKRDAGALSSRGGDRPAIGKLQTPSIFGAKPQETLSARRVSGTVVGGAAFQSSKDIGSLKNTFEPKKATNQTQDKSKFLSQQADSSNKAVDNPFVKKATATESSSTMQTKPSPFGNTFMPKVNKPEKKDEKKDDAPAATNAAPAAPAEKKLNPFEAAQQKKKEEDAKRLAERNNRGGVQKMNNPFEAKKKEEKETKPEVAPAEKPEPVIEKKPVFEKKMSPFELAQQKKKEEQATLQKNRPQSAMSAGGSEKKLNAFELAQKKRQEEEQTKKIAMPRRSAQISSLPKFTQDIKRNNNKEEESKEDQRNQRSVDKIKPFNPPKTQSMIQSNPMPMGGGGGLAPITEKENDDFKNSLAAMIGRAKPGQRKKPAPQKEEPKDKIKAGVFDDDADTGFDQGQSRTQMRGHQKNTSVDFVEFATSKPTFAARRKKQASIAGDFQDFSAQRKRVGTMAAKKKITFDSDDEDDA